MIDQWENRVCLLGGARAGPVRCAGDPGGAFFAEALSLDVPWFLQQRADEVIE
jgi:hypothetical protein